MTIYVDPSVLVSVYIPERSSAVARSIVRAAGQIPYTALHQLELPHAFERLVGRDLMTRDECRAVQTQLRDDVENQRLMPVALDLDRVFGEAGNLARLHTARFLARTSDLLHVAAAHALSCTTFVSTDGRQLAVARASGLTTVDVKRRIRRQQS